MNQRKVLSELRFIWSFCLLCFGSVREGLKKKKKNYWNFPLSVYPPSVEKNDLRAMKRILYDMGPLTLVRWPL